jgi:hypothetical protein
VVELRKRAKEVVVGLEHLREGGERRRPEGRMRFDSTDAEAARSDASTRSGATGSSWRKAGRDRVAAG